MVWNERHGEKERQHKHMRHVYQFIRKVRFTLNCLTLNNIVLFFETSLSLGESGKIGQPSCVLYDFHKPHSNSL